MDSGAVGLQIIAPAFRHKVLARPRRQFPHEVPAASPSAAVLSRPAFRRSQCSALNSPALPPTSTYCLKTGRLPRERHDQPLQTDAMTLTVTFPRCLSILRRFGGFSRLETGSTPLGPKRPSSSGTAANGGRMIQMASGKRSSASCSFARPAPRVTTGSAATPRAQERVRVLGRC